MWPMGFVSLSSSARRAEQDKKSDKKPTRVSRTNIRLSPSVKTTDRKLKTEKQNIVKKRLDFYESNESDEYKNKIDLKSFARFAVSKPERKRIGDPQKYISRSLSLQLDDEETARMPQKTVPVFRSSSQFGKYFSEGEGSVLSGAADSDADASLSRGSLPSVVMSDQEHSDKSLPTSPRIKKVQFTPSPAISPKNVPERLLDKSFLKNVDGIQKKLHSSIQELQDDSEEDMSQKDWYKQVFRVVHKLDNLYKSYPIPQVDDNENLIPPRPRFKKEPGRSASIGEATASKNERSNSLPSTCKTECQPVQAKFKNSRRVVLAGENVQDKTGNTCISSNDLIAPKRLHSLESNVNLINNLDWQQFLRPSKPSIKLCGDRNEVKQATALFDFYAHYSNELSFKRGDRLNLICRVDEHWYEAEKDGKKGLVPFNYLEVIRETANGGGGYSGLVLKDFQAHYPSEISAKRNEVVNIIRHLRGDWLEVKIGPRTGLIPAHHVSSYLNHL